MFATDEYADCDAADSLCGRSTATHALHVTLRCEMCGSLNIIL